jgi:alpha-tubulin suppressor-like RCC1 family protein
MKGFFLAIPVLATVFMACQQQPNLNQKQVLGALEVSLSSTGTNTAHFSSGLQTQGTLRENDVVFTALNSAAVSTDGAYDYLQAQFRIQNTSLTAFNNLTLYGVARSGNIGGTAISAITNFGGNATSAEQARVAPIVTPTHGLEFSGGALGMVSNREDFQAFEQSEINALQTDLNNNLGGFSSGDKALGYGFVARRCLPNCTSPTSFVRDIPASNTNGLVTIALRIPKQGASTAYTFRMTFAVVNETTTRVTRGVYPPETLASAEGRQASGELMQIGLARALSPSASRTNKGIDQVVVSSDATNGNASYAALGLGRFSTSTGGAHTCALSASGVAYCWGQGSNGIIGDNATTNRLLPVKVLDSTGADSPLRFSSISAGDVHTCGITTDGVAYCWGSAALGRLGNNQTTPNQFTPVKVQDASGDSPLRFSSISTGNFTCALTTDGVAYCWGVGSSGQLGDNATTNRQLPVKVLDSTGADSPLRFSSISAGTAHACGITTGGVAYCWGNAGSGRLGNNSTTPNQFTPVKVQDASGDSPLRFLSIHAGNASTCGITTSNVAYCWGGTDNGKLGDNVGATGSSRNTPYEVRDAAGNPSALRFAKMALASSHTCGITTDGVGYCWGLASNGRLGNNDGTIGAVYSRPVKVLTSSGADSPLRFSSISAGSGFSCAITTDGTSYCWGSAGSGRLGNNTTAGDQFTPVRDLLSFKL